MSKAQRRKDSCSKFRFQVEVGGVVIAGFNDATIPNSTTVGLQKMKGLRKHAVLSLKRGFTSKIDLYNWRKQVEQGKMKDLQKAVSVILVDAKGNTVGRWELSETWPSKYLAPDLNAEGNDVTIETLELTFEKMEKTE